MRAIDADSLKQYKMTFDTDKISGEFIPAFAIDKAPTLDVAPVVHGRWIYVKTYIDLDECNCSECGQLMTTHVGQRMNYCPNCGANMDGKQNETKQV